MSYLHKQQIHMYIEHSLNANSYLNNQLELHNFQYFVI